MKLFNYYKKAVIYPSLFTLFFCFVYTTLDNLSYKSNWQTTKSLIIVAMISSLIYTLLLYVLSLTIFLNKIKKLSKNIIWNIVTWFLLPLGYIAISLTHDVNTRIKFAFGFGNNFIFILIMTLPFVFCLFWTFLKYRQKITASDV
jgi:small-conductance mechanosensitive channel